MKFKQFINEAESFEDFLTDVKSDCSEFIKEVEKPLWRGSRKFSNFSVGEAKEDRKPKDSGFNLLFNNAFNLGAEEITKIPLIRTKALFCSNNYSQTIMYGRPYFIFPSDGCKYFFSNMVYDSYEDIQYEKSEFNNIFNNKWFKDDYILSNVQNLTIQDCLKDAEKKNYDQKDVKKFIKTLGEILSQDFNYDFADSVSFATDKRVTHEILCYGAKKYYKINVEFLTKYLNIKDRGSAIFYEMIFSKLLDKLNA